MNWREKKDKSLKKILGFNYPKVTENFKGFLSNGIKLCFENEITHEDAQYDYVLTTSDYKVINKEVDFCTDDHALICVGLGKIK